MKETIKYMLAIIGSTIGIAFILYALVGFTIWIFSDPFNWIPDITPIAEPTPVVSRFENSPFYKDCKEKGGIPTYNPWGADKCIK